MGGYGVGGGSVSLRAWRDKIGGYLFYMSSSELVGGFVKRFEIRNMLSFCMISLLLVGGWAL